MLYPEISKAGAFQNENHFKKVQMGTIMVIKSFTRDKDKTSTI